MYKIEFSMNAPICYVDRPIFDGILSYCYARDVLGKDYSTKLHIKQSEMMDFSEMPIRMHPDGYFLASWMFTDTDLEFTGSWKKRWANEYDNLADFGGKVRKVRINAGQYKSYDIPLQLHRSNKVWFYFESNDPGEVMRLIEKYLFGIGKKTSQGYGEFRSFKITESDEKSFESDIIRPIPMSDTQIENLKGELSYRFTGFRPPYWLPENQGFCLV